MAEVSHGGEDPVEDGDKFLIDLMRCKEEIVRRFEEIEKRVSERKQILLAEIVRINYRYEKSMEARRAVRKLEKSREGILKNIGEVDDLLIENATQQGMLKPMNDSILKWKLSIEMFKNVRVQFNGETELLSSITKLGQIQHEGGADYQMRTKPSLILKSSQKMEFVSLRGVCVDTNGNIYSADYSKGRIIVLSSNTNEVRYIQDSHLKSPYGVCVKNGFIFVTDSDKHKLLKFKCDGTFQKQVGSEGVKDTEFDTPYGLDIDLDNLIYICDRKNNRISVYDTDLQWKRIIKHNEVNLPDDINARNNLVILYRGNNLCILSKSGELINKIPNISDKVKRAFWFCLDKTGNILISDRGGGAIKIFSPTGILKHTLGSDLQDNGMTYCHQSQGITTLPDGKIVSVSGNPNASFYYF